MTEQADDDNKMIVICRRHKEVCANTKSGSSLPFN